MVPSGPGREPDRTHYLRGYHGAVPSMALIALLAPMASGGRPSRPVENRSFLVRFFRITQLVTKVPASTDFRLAPLGSPWLTLVVAEKRPALNGYSSCAERGPGATRPGRPSTQGGVPCLTGSTRCGPRPSR